MSSPTPSTQQRHGAGAHGQRGGGHQREHQRTPRPTSPGTKSPGCDSSTTSPSAADQEEQVDDGGLREPVDARAGQGRRQLHHAARPRGGAASAPRRPPADLACRPSAQARNASSRGRHVLHDAQLQRPLARGRWRSRARRWRPTRRCGRAAVAMASTKATVSFSTLRAMLLAAGLLGVLPGEARSTGCAAPMLVPGAMAATFEARVMNTPALPARAPEGPTQTSTGTRAPRKARTIVPRGLQRAAGRVQPHEQRIAPRASASRTQSAGSPPSPRPPRRPARSAGRWAPPPGRARSTRGPPRPRPPQTAPGHTTAKTVRAREPPWVAVRIPDLCGKRPGVEFSLPLSWANASEQPARLHAQVLVHCRCAEVRGRRSHRQGARVPQALRWCGGSRPPAARPPAARRRPGPPKAPPPPPGPRPRPAARPRSGRCRGRSARVRARSRREASADPRRSVKSTTSERRWWRANATSSARP